MDLATLSDDEKLRGFLALKENPFFRELQHAVSKHFDQQTRRLLDDEIKTKDELIQHLQLLGELRGLRQQDAFLRLTLSTLQNKQREQVEGDNNPTL